MTQMIARIREVVDAAVWAPSGDNSQPWHFTLRDDTLRVFLEPERDNPILNFRLSGTYIAHGALIENLLLAAPLSGLVAHARVLPDAVDPLCTAEIVFTEGTPAPDPLASMIRERHTNRKRYEKKAIAPDVLASFTPIAQSVSRAHIAVITDAKAIRAVAEASALMEQIALETPALRALFFGSILWSSEANRKGEQGLYIKTMELPALAQIVFPYLNNPRIVKVTNAIEFPKIAGKINATLYASSPALGLVTMDDESLDSYIAAGQATERAWLCATRHHLAFQPVTGILFLARSVENNAANGLLPKHFPAIRESYATIRRAFSISPGEIPAMMFRMGYASAVTARSGRRPPDIHAS